MMLVNCLFLSSVNSYDMSCGDVVVVVVVVIITGSFVVVSVIGERLKVNVIKIGSYDSSLRKSTRPCANDHCIRYRYTVQGSIRFRVFCIDIKRISIFDSENIPNGYITSEHQLLVALHYNVAA